MTPLFFFFGVRCAQYKVHAQCSFAALAPHMPCMLLVIMFSIRDKDVCMCVNVRVYTLLQIEISVLQFTFTHMHTSFYHNKVNCETDFVARNTQFCSLVSAATQATLDLHQQQQQESDQRSESDHPPSLWQRQLTAADITSLGPWSHYTTLNDMVTEKFGSLSENLAIARGCLMRAKEGLLCSYVYCNVDLPLPEPTITSDQTATTTSTTTNTSGHNNTTEVVAMGTYVALVHLLPKEGTDLDVEVAQKLGRAVGQHIVGLNPTSIYPRPRDESGEEPGDKGSALVEQALLIGDDSLTVGDVLEKNRMTVSSFMRYGLGETQDDC